MIEKKGRARSLYLPEKGRMAPKRDKHRLNRRHMDQYAYRAQREDY